MKAEPNRAATRNQSSAQLAMAFAFRRMQEASEKRCYIEVVAICESVICDRLRSALGDSITVEVQQYGARYNMLAKLGRADARWKPLIGEINRWYKKRSRLVHGVVGSGAQRFTPTEFMRYGKQAASQGVGLARKVCDTQRSNLRATKTDGSKVLSQKPTLAIAGSKKSAPESARSNVARSAATPQSKGSTEKMPGVGPSSGSVPSRLHNHYLTVLQLVSALLDEYHFSRTSIAGEGAGQIIHGVAAPAARRSKLRIGLSALLTRVDQAGLKEIRPMDGRLTEDERNLLTRDQSLILRYAFEVLAWSERDGFSVAGDGAKEMVGEEGVGVAPRTAKKLHQILKEIEATGSLFQCE